MAINKDFLVKNGLQVTDDVTIGGNLSLTGTMSVAGSGLATVATTGSYSDLSGTPTLATVATTGDYDDLTNTPTITIQNVTSLPGSPDANTLYIVTSS